MMSEATPCPIFFPPFFFKASCIIFFFSIFFFLFVLFLFLLLFTIHVCVFCASVGEAKRERNESNSWQREWRRGNVGIATLFKPTSVFTSTRARLNIHTHTKKKERRAENRFFESCIARFGTLDVVSNFTYSWCLSCAFNIPNVRMGWRPRR